MSVSGCEVVRRAAAPKDCNKCCCYLSLKAGIGVWRLDFGPMPWNLSLEASIDGRGLFLKVCKPLQRLLKSDADKRGVGGVEDWR